MRKPFPWAPITDWGWIPAITRAGSLALHLQTYLWDGSGLVREGQRYAVCPRRP